MNPERMRSRKIKFQKREWAVLKGWRLEFNKSASRKPDAEGYANIVEDQQEIVEGCLYDISEKDIENLDKYEGYPDHYKKISVNVNLKSSEEVEAITYIAQQNKVRDGLKPCKNYLSHLLKGCDLLSKEYCERLKKWETLD